MRSDLYTTQHNKKHLQVSVGAQLLSSGKRGSNSRPSAWEADALPTELLPLLLNTKVITRFETTKALMKN